MLGSRVRSAAVVVAIAATVLAATVVGLGPSAAATRAAASATPTTAGLSIGTLDVNLTPVLAGQDAVVSQVASSGFDVLALQGVWSSAGEAAILSDPDVQAKYPYHYSPPAAQSTFAQRPSVSRNDSENYVNCLVGRGDDIRTIITPAQPADPICSFLGLNVRFLSGSLYSALVATLQTEPNTFAGGVDAISRLYDESPSTAVNYGYDGRPGQLILSAYPIEDPQNTTFETDLVRRDNILATIDGLKIVFANWPINYLEEQDPGLATLEYGALQSDLAQDAIADSPDLIVGSLNTSPDYQPEAYQLLRTDRRYRPISSVDTYCPSGAAGFSRCEGQNPRATDNIVVARTARCFPPVTFATDQVSEHIGVSARCGPAPVVTALSSHTGPTSGGQTITITGTGFTGASDVIFANGVPATSFTVVSDTQVTAVTPPHARGLSRVRVQTIGRSDNSAANRYRYR